MAGLVAGRLVFVSCLILMLPLLPLEAKQAGSPGAPGPRPQGPGRRSPAVPPGTDPATGPRDRKVVESTGTGQISGRVTGGDAGQPLRRAIVRMHGEALEDGGRLTTTDEHGRYQFRDLPAGRLLLNAGKGGYVRLSYGQRRAGEGGRPLELADGQKLDHIDFNLPRGGVITGRVADEYGEPVAELPVQVLRYRYVEGRRQLVASGSMMSRTDDLGRFRIFGLPAGDYYVMASAQRGMFMGAQSDTRSGFAPTYFPGTPSLNEAQTVRVGTGEEMGSLNFAVVSARTAKVTGVVIDSQGQPVDRGFIEVQSDTKSSAMFAMHGGGMIRSGGNFTISNLVPGDYILHVNLETVDSYEESATVPVSIASEDITGLTIVTSSGSLAMGQALFETMPPDGLKPADFGFYATAVNPISMRGGLVTLKDDWTFEARLHEGPALIRATKLPDGWVLKSVMHGGVDVTDRGIEFRPGERIEGLQLVLSNRTSVLTGAVTDERHRPARDYTVVVFPEDPGGWTPNSRYLFAARPTQEGRYEVRKLPAGQYLAVAVDYLEDGQHTDPDYLERLRGYATAFEIRDGERRDLNLELVRVQ